MSLSADELAVNKLIKELENVQVGTDFFVASCLNKNFLYNVLDKDFCDSIDLDSFAVYYEELIRRKEKLINTAYFVNEYDKFELSTSQIRNLFIASDEGIDEEFSSTETKLIEMLISIADGDIDKFERDDLAAFIRIIGENSSDIDSLLTNFGVKLSGKSFKSIANIANLQKKLNKESNTKLTKSLLEETKSYSK